MNEETTIIADEGFEDFEAAFLGEDGNQTDDAAETTEEVTEDAAGGAEEQPDEEESAAEDTEGGSGEDGAEEPPAPQETSFTIRVNKEDRVVNREEMFSLAQKGADYDRVKGQVAERDKTISELTAQIEGNKDSLEMLSLISESVGKPIPELLETLHVSLRMKNGETEAEAKANIRALKAERQIKAAEAAQQKQAEKPDPKARAEKEVADFHSRFPGVELSEELCKELTEDVRKGMTIADAYQKREDARKDARIAELERQLAADKQNKKNKAKAVGSQTDSGGRRTKSAEDDFFAAFEK
jgi:hypothetical protein